MCARVLVVMIPSVKAVEHVWRQDKLDYERHPGKLDVGEVSTTSNLVVATPMVPNSTTTMFDPGGDGNGSAWITRSDRPLRTQAWMME
ncbi:hypothetical protein PC116_g25839 [Phytophthora cactorum]|uniref:Uncharacterized protein n=1 Tax=Phytophthora cactorum TaxID=29920 RepID=A0A8T1B2Y6_9STRA|nr:hypothetical protein PC117_g23268 [Phytophthora cactorum]KAG2985770.1 hypothetical protein PC119_g20079 [Phytophthora cactorum]KAG4225732.1 hypothetical protein PC116_g25839 [Phytophthora cactorum]